MISKSWDVKGQAVIPLKEARTLLLSYWNLHKEKPGRPLGWSGEDILKLYSNVVEELKKNNVELEDYNEMDYLSCGGENHEQVGLKEVISFMSDFSVNVPHILLAGSIVENGSTDGDIEVILCGKEHVVPTLFSIELKKAILDMFPNRYWSRVRFTSFNGSAEEYPGKNIGLYCPLFRRFYDSSIRSGSYFSKNDKQSVEVMHSADDVIGEVFKTWNKTKMEE